MNRFLLLVILSFVTVLSACATDAVSEGEGASQPGATGGDTPDSDKDCVREIKRVYQPYGGGGAGSFVEVPGACIQSASKLPAKRRASDASGDVDAVLDQPPVREFIDPRMPGSAYPLICPIDAEISGFIDFDNQTVEFKLLNESTDSVLAVEKIYFSGEKQNLYFEFEAFDIRAKNPREVKRSDEDEEVIFLLPGESHSANLPLASPLLPYLPEPGSPNWDRPHGRGYILYRGRIEIGKFKRLAEKWKRENRRRGAKPYKVRGALAACRPTTGGFFVVK